MPAPRDRRRAEAGDAGHRRQESPPPPPAPAASEAGGKAAATHNSNIHWPCNTRLQLEPPSTCTRLRSSPGLPAREEDEEAEAGPSTAARSRAAGAERHRHPLLQPAAMFNPPAPGSEGASGRRGGGACAGARRRRAERPLGWSR